MTLRGDIMDQVLKAMPDIDIDNVFYLGDGDYGTAYSIGDGKVLKITTSRREFELAKELIGKDIEGLAKVYEAGQISSFEYKIILEEVEIDADVDYCFYEVEYYLRKQGWDISNIGCFDIDDYEKEFEKIPDDVKAFIPELIDIISSCRRLGMQRIDIHADNLGRDKKTSKLKMFDVDEPSYYRGGRNY
jgi:hypothetical protein